MFNVLSTLCMFDHVSPKIVKQSHGKYEVVRYISICARPRFVSSITLLFFIIATTNRKHKSRFRSTNSKTSRQHTAPKQILHDTRRYHHSHHDSPLPLLSIIVYRISEFRGLLASMGYGTPVIGIFGNRQPARGATHIRVREDLENMPRCSSKQSSDLLGFCNLAFRRNYFMAASVFTRWPPVSVSYIRTVEAKY